MKSAVQRYREIREQSDIFKLKGILKNQIIKHIQEAEEAVMEEAATILDKENCPLIAAEIRALRPR
jgi:hypothetical protein